MENMSLPPTPQLYIPVSSRFTNNILLKRLGNATPTTISFQQSSPLRCHDLSHRRSESKSRWQKQYTIIKPLNCRRYSSFEKTKIMKGAGNEQKRRLSISRMLQETEKVSDFSYIRQFYRKPIQKEMAVKREKKEANKFDQILSVSEYRPHKKSVAHRYNPTADARCRCHRNSNTVDMKNLASNLSPRRPCATTCHTSRPNMNQRRVIQLGLLDNWNVESWNSARGEDKEEAFLERTEGSHQCAE